MGAMAGACIYDAWVKGAAKIAANASRNTQYLLIQRSFSSKLGWILRYFSQSIMNQAKW